MNRWAVVAVLALLPLSVSGSFSLGTFYSRTYDRISAGDSALFHFYVINTGNTDFNVRLYSPSDRFYVSFYPYSSFRMSECQESGWTYFRGKYVRACKISVKIAPKEDIVNGRYVVPVVIEAKPTGDVSGIVAVVSQVRQINYEIDVYGGRLFEPPEPVEIVRSASRIFFGEDAPAPQGSPVTGGVERGISSVIRFTGTGESPAGGSDVPRPVEGITGFVIKESSGNPVFIAAIIVVAAAGFVVVKHVLY